MDRQAELEHLRELFLTAQGSDVPRILAVVGSLVLTGVVLWLVRRRALAEEHTPIWIAISVGLTLVSVTPGLLQAITRWIGAWTPSSTLFFLGQLCLVVLCLNFAVRLSRAGVQIKVLGQELAVLRSRLHAIVGPKGDD
jgi:hypothetical protein